MHLEYWGLSTHPFSNVPDPDFYFDKHDSVQLAVNGIVDSLAGDKEVFATIIGPAGIGKTMAMRIVLEKIDRSAFCIAFITNPDMTFPQFLSEIIGQINGQACVEKNGDKLVSLFESLMISIHEKGKKPLIFIDEGNAAIPHNFESIYMLIKILQDSQTSFSLILAGKPDTETRLNNHRAAHLINSIEQYSPIQGLKSRDILRDYIHHRLTKAGSNKELFEPEAIAALWSISEHGNPRVINKLCTLCLKFGETNSLKQIDAKTVSAVGTSFMKSNIKSFSKNSSAMPEIQPLIEQTEKIRTRVETSDGRKEPINPNPKDKNISYEIKPEFTAKEPSQTAKAGSEIHKYQKNNMSFKELEELASRLATERIKSRNDLNDAFEAWEEVRNDILSQLTKSKSATTN